MVIIMVIQIIIHMVIHLPPLRLLSEWLLLSKVYRNEKYYANGQLSHATVTIIASDGNGLHKGDFVISMPPELGEKLALTLHQLSHCPSSKKRSALLDCVGANAVGVIQAANGGAGELAGLIIAPTRMPDLAPALAAVLQTVIRNGRQFQGVLSNADYNRLAEVAFMVTYASIVLKEAVNVPNPTEWVFPASGIATSSAPTSSSSCPPDRSRPCCVNCGGNNGNLKCKGIASAGNAWKGCPCLEPVQYPYRPFENKQAFLDAQKELASLPDRTTTSAPPSAPTVGGLNCNQMSYADGCHRNDVHKSYVDKLADYMGQGFTADFTPDTRNFTREMRKGGTSGSGVTYLMNVGWIQGCTSQKSQKLARPIDPDQDFDWQGLLKRTYYSCTLLPLPTITLLPPY